MEWFEKEMYVTTLDQERRNISDIIAYKYMDECFKGCELNNYERDLLKEVFRYILVSKGGQFWSRYTEYREHGLKPTDKYIEYGGFKNDYAGVLTHMRNYTDVIHLKEIVIGGHAITKIVWHIMRLVYLTPKFVDIMEKRMKFKVKQ